MLESIAIALFLLLGVGLVYLKARTRLETPPARRSREPGRGDAGGADNGHGDSAGAHRNAAIDRHAERDNGTDGDGGDGGD